MSGHDEKKLTPYQNAQVTLQMMESGILELNNHIKYGLLLLGKTKAGKTTTSHYLANHILEGGYNDQQSIVYKLREVRDRRYNDAKIGDKESESETQIPNFFCFEENGELMYLIDCPGYLDSYGFFRIISNRFFHFQVFSKVENIKFIITFTYNDMKKTADTMKETFKEFLSGFSNLDQIKDKILKATSIMITAVPRNKDLEGVRQFFKNTPENISQDLRQFYSDLKKYVLKEQKVYIFYQAELGKQCDSQNTLLKEINKKSIFWKRQLNDSNEVDMKNINLSLVKYLEQNPKLFNKELKSFENHYIKYVFNELNAFVGVIRQLINDNEREESYQFIDKMAALVKQKQKGRSKISDKQLDFKYKEKKENLKNTLFSSNKQLSGSSSYSTDITADVPLWLNKLKTLKIIQKVISSIQSLRATQFQLQMLLLLADNAVNILSSLINLAKCRKSKDDKEQKTIIEVLNQFAYQTYINIQISNKLYRLTKSSTNCSDRKQLIINLAQNSAFILIQYPAYVRGMFLKAITKSSSEILQSHIDNIKMDENVSTKASQMISKFLQNSKQEINNNASLNPTIKSDLVTKLNNRIAKLKNNVFEVLKLQQNPNLKKLVELQTFRKDIYNQLEQCKRNAYDNENLKVQNDKCISLMAQCLFKNGKYQVSKELSDLLFDAHRVFEILDIEEKDKRKVKNNEKAIMEHLIIYMKTAHKYHRKELALAKAQEAYHYAKDMANAKQITHISNFLKEILHDNPPQPDLYSSFMFDRDTYITQIPQNLSQRILEIAEKASPMKNSK